MNAGWPPRGRPGVLGRVIVSCHQPLAALLCSAGPGTVWNPTSSPAVVKVSFRTSVPLASKSEY